MESLKILRRFLCTVFLVGLGFTPVHAKEMPERQSVTRVEQAAPSALPVEQECQPLPFGQSLFLSEAGNTKIMSSKQRVAPGDRIALATWGAVQAEETVTVDSQGYIYIKDVGPVQVAGKTEESLGREIKAQISRVFRDDVEVYARLEQNSGTPVMVTGGVRLPGQYFGSAEDNIVVYLQRAGGILDAQGSYRNIRVMRNGRLLQKTDLYPLLQNGLSSNISWAAGDVIVVDLPAMQVSATGAVKRCATFEFSSAETSGNDLFALAQPLPGVTHAVLDGYRDGMPFTKVVSLEALKTTSLHDGDKIRFYAAPQSEQMTIAVEGQSLGNKIMVVPLHTSLSAVLDHIPVNPEISNTQAVFIKRKSVALAQKEALDESLNRLLQSALTAPAQSDGEATIRAAEAQLIEEFVARTRDVKQEGRVVVMQDGNLRDLPLEDGDIIVIPQKTNVVSIEGEVVLPRSVVLRENAGIADYVQMAGGFTERALKKDFVVVKPNGDAIRTGEPVIEAGDRILILPRVDSKNMQTIKDIVQILYQVAVGAGVLLTI